MITKINWPDGKRFAFTVFDDTDLITMQNGPGIYQFLYDLGILTTKSVWPIKGGNVPTIGGVTCKDPEYLEWVRQLKKQGFEIALHNVTYTSSRREQIIKGLEQYKRYFNVYPKIQVNHADCEDSIYWGDKRLSRLKYVPICHTLIKRGLLLTIGSPHLKGRIAIRFAKQFQRKTRIVLKKKVAPVLCILILVHLISFRMDS